MFIKLYKTLMIAGLLTIISSVSYGQARSSIGIGAGVNKTFASGYNVGYGFTLQGSIRLSKKFALVPSLGLEKINADYAIIHEGYSSYTRDNVALFTVGLSGKYYMSEQWFARAGALLYLGADGGGPSSGGIGGTAAFGYDVPVNNGHNLELTLRTDLIKVRDKGDITPVAGLRVAYNF
jgi:hypothetical protein